MGNFIGVLVRRERLKQNLSQEGLCKGICAVSYLSKIEQGKADAGEDILLPLMQRLGIQYETDKAFLSQAEKNISTIYEGIFAGMDALPSYREKLNWLAGRKDRCLASPYMLDAILLLTYFKKMKEEPDLSDFIPCMTRQQYEFYLLLQTELQKDALSVQEASDELLRLNPCGFYTCMMGVLCYWKGRYMEATHLLSRSYDLSAQEGSVYLMLQAKMFLGNCYSDSGQKELMLEQYRVARRLAAAVSSDLWSSTIDYNVGSTFLEWGMVEEAYALLQNVVRHDALYYHKLAIALEKLGRRNEAISALSRARAAGAENTPRPIINEMLDLVEYRLRHPNYLRSSAYSKLMGDTFAHIRRTMPSGYARFHLPYMLEVLEAERRYKDAYHLSVEFSDILHLSDD